MFPHLAVISTSLAGAYGAQGAQDNRWAVFEEWLIHSSCSPAHISMLGEKKKPTTSLS